MPAGTHDPRKFVRPAELRAEFAAAGIALDDMTGFAPCPGGGIYANRITGDQLCGKWRLSIGHRPRTIRFNVQAATTAKSRYQCLHRQVIRVLQHLNDRKYFQVRCRHNAFYELQLQNQSRHHGIQTLSYAAIGVAVRSPRQAQPVMGRPAMRRLRWVGPGCGNMRRCGLARCGLRRRRDGASLIAKMMASFSRWQVTHIITATFWAGQIGRH